MRKIIFFICPRETLLDQKDINEYQGSHCLLLKEIWRNINLKKINTLTSSNLNEEEKIELLDLYTRKNNLGMKTGLKPINKFKPAPKGSNNLESALKK